MKILIALSFYLSGSYQTTIRYTEDCVKSCEACGGEHGFLLGCEEHTSWAELENALELHYYKVFK